MRSHLNGDRGVHEGEGEGRAVRLVPLTGGEIDGAAQQARGGT